MYDNRFFSDLDRSGFLNPQYDKNVKSSGHCGRPKKNENERRTQRISLTVTADEKEQVATLARKNCMQMNEYIRYLIRLAARQNTEN